MDILTAIALPAGTVLLGVLGFIANKASIYRFNQKHPEIARFRARRRSKVKVVEITDNDDLRMARELSDADLQEAEIKAQEQRRIEVYRKNLELLEALVQSQVRQAAGEPTFKGATVRANRILPPKPTVREHERDALTS